MCKLQSVGSKFHLQVREGMLQWLTSSASATSAETEDMCPMNAHTEETERIITGEGYCYIIGAINSIHIIEHSVVFFFDGHRWVWSHVPWLHKGDDMCM